MSKNKPSIPNESHFEESQIYLRRLESVIRSKETEEHQSEQRIRFFLSLITGIAAFIGILLREKINSDNILLISIISSSILFLFGILTFSRIIWSVSIIDDLQKGIAALDKLIFKLNPSIKQSLIKEGIRGSINLKLLSHLKGTYAQYMYLIQCLLCAGIIFLFGALKNVPLYLSIHFAVLIVLQVFWFFLIWSIRVRTIIKWNYLRSFYISA
jgi:hypothetical protein